MSKNNSSEPSDAEDYLAHLNWHGKHGGGHWRTEPKWKYKVIRKHYQMSPVSRILMYVFWLGMPVIVAGYLFYLAKTNQLGLALAGLIIALGFGGVLFFALRDAQKEFGDKKDDED